MNERGLILRGWCARTSLAVGMIGWVLWPAAVRSDSVVCLVAPTGAESPISTDCDQIAPIRWPSNTRGFSADGAWCEVIACDACATTEPVPGMDPCYAWTVSLSATNEWENYGELAAGPVDLYLWLACTAGDHHDGAAWVELRVEVNDAEYVAFHPEWYVLNFGTKENLELAIGGCPDAPKLIGRFELVYTPTSVDVSTWGHAKASYR